MMMSRRTVTLSLAALLAAPRVAFAAGDAAGLAAELEARAASGRFSGAVLAARGEDTLFEAAYGVAKRNTNRANTLDTRFRYASMGKMFTGVAVLQLVQAGKLALDSRLGDLLAGYPNEQAKVATVHQLLTHTAGTGNIFGPGAEERLRGLSELAGYVAEFAAEPLLFAPGKRHEYSNFGYVLLGRIVEAVTGTGYDDYAAEHIFEPAGMTATGISRVREADRALLAVPYSKGAAILLPPGEQPGNGPAGGEPKIVRRGPDEAPGPGGGRKLMGPGPGKGGAGGPPPDAGDGELSAVEGLAAHRGTSAGGGYSTVGDFRRFAAVLLAHRLLDAEHTALATSAHVELPAGPGEKWSYGYGFGVQVGASGIRRFGHNGGAPGCNGVLQIFPDTGHVLVVLANIDPPVADEVAELVIEQLA